MIESIIALALASPVAISSPCLGRTVPECIAHLRFFLKILEDKNLQSELDAFNAKDVNGKPLTVRRSVSILGELPEESGPYTANHRPIIFLLDTSNRITRITFDLTKDPVVAKTEQEYEDTRIYRYFAMVTDRASCRQAATALDFYQFFENSVKPKIKRARKETESGSSYAREVTTATSGPIPICGRKLTYQLAYGSDTDRIRGSNWSGSFFDPAIVIQ